MPLASQILAAFRSDQREACPVKWGFYDCGGFQGCCPLSPCSFTDKSDPCQAAIDHRNDDGHDSDDASSAVKTLTASLPDFTSAILETLTLDDPQTSTDEADHWSSASSTPASSSSSSLSSSSSPSSSSSSSSSAKPSSLSSVPALTTSGGSTLSTSITSALSSNNTTTRTLPTPLPTVLPPDGSDSKRIIPDAAIAGISVISALVAFALLAVFLWFARRRLIAKRMSSTRGDSPIPASDMKLAMCRRPSFAEEAGPGDADTPALLVHTAEIAANSRRPYTRRVIAKDVLEAWNARNASAPEALQAGAAEADSKPIHVELDSAETQRPGPSIPRPQSVMDTTKPLPRRPSVVNAQNYPSQLVPGLHAAGRNDDPGADASQSQGQGQSNRDSVGGPRTVPRATLNATEDERMNNLYANSWAYGP
ncbi:hypothetical protein ANO14919_083160 [Xylariales sp. No.14919]|nr:hypothetical protein ANO14919_083160 [Xylariales sp. No.14919]